MDSEKEIEQLLKNCEKNKAGLEEVKGFEDKKPEVDLLSVAVQLAGGEEALIGGKDEW